MWIIYDFLNIPRSAVVRAEAIRKAGGELVAVAAQQLVNADKLKALLCERVDRAQDCRDRSVHRRRVRSQYLLVVCGRFRAVAVLYCMDNGMGSDG